MQRIKKIGILLALSLISIQFIRPSLNKSSLPAPTHFSKIIHTPDGVDGILKTSCYDCHSNNTDYPWYAHVQPLGWLLESHINDGKEELNFSDFGSYSRRRQISKLRAIESSVRDRSMPLKSYRMLHKTSRLTDMQQELMIEWARKSLDSLQATK